MVEHTGTNLSYRFCFFLLCRFQACSAQLPYIIPLAASTMHAQHDMNKEGWWKSPMACSFAIPTSLILKRFDSKTPVIPACLPRHSFVFLLFSGSNFRSFCQDHLVQDTDARKPDFIVTRFEDRWRAKYDYFQPVAPRTMGVSGGFACVSQPVDRITGDPIS